MAKIDKNDYSENKGTQSDWPRRKNGQVDWNFIFNDTERGLIPAINSARTIVSLKGIFGHVLQLLFARTSDSQQNPTSSEAMNLELDKRTPRKVFSKLKSQILAFLELILSERIRKEQPPEPNKPDKREEENSSQKDQTKADDTPINNKRDNADEKLSSGKKRKRIISLIPSPLIMKVSLA